MKKIYDSNNISKKIQYGETLSFSIDDIGSESSILIFGKKHVGSGSFIFSIESKGEVIYQKEAKFLSRNTMEIKIPIYLNKDVKNIILNIAGTKHSKVFIQKVCFFSVESMKIENDISYERESSFLFIVPYTIYGGAEIYIESLIKNITKSDKVKVSVLAHKHNSIGSRFSQENVNVIQFYSQNSISSNILQKDYDYIIYYNSMSIYRKVTSLSRKIRGKIIEIYHSDFEWSDAISKQSERSGIDLLLKITESVGKHINFSSKILRVPIDIKRFSPKSRITVRRKLDLDDKKTIGTICRLSPEKNLGYFLDIAKMMPEYNFVIVGDGPEKKSLLYRIRTEGIGNVNMVGYHENTEDYLNSFDLFILTSHIEGTPISMLEAMSCGTNVVVPKVGGIPDIIKDDRNFLKMNLKEDISIIKKCFEFSPDFRKYILDNHSDEKISNDFLRYCFHQDKVYRKIRPWEVALNGEYI